MYYIKLNQHIAKCAPRVNTKKYMRTWKELEKDFRDLSSQMSHAFLDIQWGNTNENWYIGGMVPTEVKSKFRLLSYLAGQKLLFLHLSGEDLETLKKDEPDKAWFRALKDISGALSDFFEASQIGKDGQFLGSIYHARINNLAEVSANFCLHCEIIELSQPFVGIQEELIKRGLGAAAVHWHRSEQNRKSNPPDFIIAANEAIKALESVAKSVSSLPNGTLGDCITYFRNKKSLNPGMIKCLEGLWAAANNIPGIRHGASKEKFVQTDEIEFLLDSSKSAIKLLLSVSISDRLTSVGKRENEV
ncbi:MAG: hypothetical protein EPO24_08950 [Bacteroidetes bacterium]|nr:MAG: hypothetical protein EPO24_08950 [Bacteroidota bacterium]